MESLLLIVVVVILAFAFWDSISKVNQHVHEKTSAMAIKGSKKTIDESNQAYKEIVDKHGKDFMTATEIHDKIFSRKKDKQQPVTDKG